jgi:hypothetical protein
VAKIKVLLSLFLIVVVSSLAINKQPNPSYETSSSNFDFTTKQIDKTEVYQNYSEEDILSFGYQKVSESNSLILYLHQEKINITVYDKAKNYYWFGYLPARSEPAYTERLKQFVESGLTVEYYDSANLNIANVPLTNKNAGTVVEYEYFDAGFKAAIDLTKVGISFELTVFLEADELQVNIPHNSIVEIPYQTIAMKNPKEYKLRSIYVFPFLGADNFQINGYAMIPDGSGALIRYEDKTYNTGYIKRIFGTDQGIQQQQKKGHLKAEAPVTMPIFGINHGYNQQAFLAEIKEGFGAAELHSYPYMYNNLKLNTTFFVYKTRDQSLIRLSGGEISTISIINKNPYPADFKLTYSFLQNKSANYSGMAKRYQNSLNLEHQNKDYPLYLELIGMDEKPYIFGQRKVVLTSYKEALNIIEEVNTYADGLLVNYKNYNRNGVYNKNSYKFSLALKLGGKKNFENLTEYVSNNENVSLAITTNAAVVNKTKLFDRTLRKTSLDQFVLESTSSKGSNAYVLTITDFAKRILSNSKKYEKHHIETLYLENVEQLLFSYQLQNKTVYREQMIAQLIEQISRLNNYELIFNQPAGFLFPYAYAYYGALLESSNYSYMTDTIPFVSLVLSGYTPMFSQHLNFYGNLSDVGLKMVEYNIKPAFVLTAKQSHHLRFTNFEHLLSTEYANWKDKIEQLVLTTNSLKDVSGQKMLNHEIVLDGLAKITYETKIVYVNYNQNDVSIDGIVISANSYYIEEAK